MTPAAYEPLVERRGHSARLIALVVLNAMGVVSALFAYQLYGSDLITLHFASIWPRTTSTAIAGRP